MQIVSPKAELWFARDYMKKHIVKCAKVCYKSDIEVDVNKFIEARIRAGHNSILRHGTLYYKIPAPPINYPSDHITFVVAHSKISNLKHSYITNDNENLYVAINMQTYYENKELFDELEKYKIDESEAYDNKTIREYIFRYTFYLQTQISTSRELNRVSPNNILEESTRHVDQGILCRPWWCDDYWIDNDIKLIKIRDAYFKSCECAFDDYQDLIKRGLNKEDARGVLPLDTCTHVVYTYTIQEWREIINKRYFGTTGKPHGNAQEVIGMVKLALEIEGYDF